jgi:hypothetical protein
MILPALLLAVAVLAPQTLPANAIPPSNTFITATESVIDQAASVDIHAPDDVFQAQMQPLKMAQENLTNMVSSSASEHDVLTAVSDLVFALSTCHIQSKDGAPAPNCDSRISAARTSAMQSINRHKQNGHWLEGPPA